MRTRNLVVVYLSGGNDALSTVVPYQDPFYYSRRPAIAIPAGQVLQIGSDSTGKTLGLHPRLAGLREIFNQGRLAVVQRTGYLNSSRSHFQGTDIWGTADPNAPTGLGWLGRYLDTLPAPVNTLAAWNTTRETPRALMTRSVSVPAIPDARTYSLSSPNSGAEAQIERLAATQIASHVGINRPHLSFVNGSIRGALDTLDRVATVNVRLHRHLSEQRIRVGPAHGGRRDGPRNRDESILGHKPVVSIRTLARVSPAVGRMRISWARSATASAFYTDLQNQGLLNDTLILQFSEFGRRISENGSQGTDHGAAGVMMAVGGAYAGHPRHRRIS